MFRLVGLAYIFRRVRNMSIVGYLVKPELEVRKVKDGERAPVICSEYYRDVDDYFRGPFCSNQDLI